MVTENNKIKRTNPYDFVECKNPKEPESTFYKVDFGTTPPEVILIWAQAGSEFELSVYLKRRPDKKIASVRAVPSNGTGHYEATLMDNITGYQDVIFSFKGSDVYFIKWCVE